MRVWDSVGHAQAQGLARRISKAPLRGVPATALDLSLVIEKYQKLTSTSIQNEVQKVFQNPRQKGPKCTHVGSKNEAWVIFEVFEVLGGLGLPSASWEVFWAALG